MRKLIKIYTNLLFTYGRLIVQISVYFFYFINYFLNKSILLCILTLLFLLLRKSHKSQNPYPTSSKDLLFKLDI